MKTSNKRKYFGWLGASALLLTGACANESELNYDQIGSDGGNEIAFSITREKQTPMTRAEETAWNFGDGSHADVLIFAIYKENAGDWEICSSYNNGLKANAATSKVPKGEIWITGGTPLSENSQSKVKPATNQFGVTFTGELNMTIRFRVEDTKNYKLVCWAQNSECEAYDTSDLTKVKVNYTYTDNGDTKNYLNNDEFRDAFCETGNISANSKTGDIILRRPFAQINIGTAGWDYEGAAVLGPNKVTYTDSKITVTGVADTYNVITGAASVSAGNTSKILVTYDAAKLPAFTHVSDLTRNDEKENYQPYDKEVFLKLDLNSDNKFSDYIDWTDYKAWSIENGGTEGYPDTETFKYLSMCYILAPGVPTATTTDGKTTYTGATVDITFSTSGQDREDNNKTVTFESDEIKNVPVQKNWRTNIVGFNVFLYRQGFNLWVVPEYCGDHNNIDEWADNKNNQFDTDWGWDYYPTEGKESDQNGD